MAVYRTRGDKYNPANPYITHGFHHTDSASHIDDIVFTRVEHRLGDGYFCGKMVDTIDILEECP